MTWLGSKDFDELLAKMVGSEGSTRKTVFKVIGALLLIGILVLAGYYLWKIYLKNMIAGATQPSGSTGPTGPSPEIHHSAVLLEKPPEPKPAPPGGFPISVCKPENFHVHIAKDYRTYTQGKPSKAFVTNNSCSQAYFTQGQADDHEATQRAFAACQRREPGRCGVVSVNDTVYSHT